MPVPETISTGDAAAIPEAFVTAFDRIRRAQLCKLFR